MKMKKYIWNVLIALDHLCNSIIGGSPDETISSRMGRNLAKKDCVLCNFLCGLLNLIQKDHCVKAIANDRERAEEEIRLS